MRLVDSSGKKAGLDQLMRGQELTSEPRRTVVGSPRTTGHCSSQAGPGASGAGGDDQEVSARVRVLTENLARITDACTLANQQGQLGSLFFLLRKKWQLMQELFEAENRLRRLQ